MVVRPLLHHVGRTVYWRVDVSVFASIIEGTQSPTGQKVLPAPGSTVVIVFGFNDQKMTLRGRVADELNMEDNVDLVVYCPLSVKDSTMLIHHVKKGKIEGTGTISVKCDFTSADRQIAGFRGIALQVDESAVLERLGPHPNAQHFLLNYDARFPGALRDVPDVGQTLASYATQQGIASGAFDELCAWFGFPGMNESQKGSILGAIKGGRLTVVHGPPGTGKSQTQACLVVIRHFVFGSKVAVAAPLNTACDAIMDKIVDVYHNVLKPRGLRWNLVRLLTMAGTPIADDAIADVGPDGLKVDVFGLDELSIRQRELWRSKPENVGYSFHEAKKSFCKRSRDDSAMPEKTRNA